MLINKMTSLKNEWINITEFFNNSYLTNIVIGLIVGSAFSQMVTSFTTNMVYPVINYYGNFDLDDKFLVLKGGIYEKDAKYKTLADAQVDKAVVIAWGTFLKSVLNLVIQGISVFYIIKFVIHIHHKIKAIK
jgi:large conductance mechanosensitive channel